MSLGEKDITQKLLLAFNDVFTDLLNVLLMKDRRYFKEDEFVDRLPRSVYKADGKVMSLLSVMTKDHRFEDAYNDMVAEKEEVHNMCAVLDKIEKRGYDNGVDTGIGIGLIKAYAGLVNNHIITLETACAQANLSEAEFLQKAEAAKKWQTQ